MKTTFLPSPHLANVIMVAFALLLSSCATRKMTTGWQADVASPEPGATLSVIPFENLSHSRNAGLILTDLATTVAYAQSYFHVREISSIQDLDDVAYRRLEITPWQRQVGVNTANATEIAELLETDWALAGSVGEYGFVDGYGETANVGITLRLVQASDGEVVWAGSLSRRSACSAFNEESVHRLAHLVITELMETMQVAIEASATPAAQDAN